MNIEKLIPNGEYKVTILSGVNGSGKTNLLNKFAKQFNYRIYNEIFTNGLTRKNDILNFCYNNDYVVIDNIELYIDGDNQKELLNEIFKTNPKINLVCSTHSPFIVMNGFLNKIIEIIDL